MPGCCCFKLNRVQMFSLFSQQYRVIVFLLSRLPWDLTTDLADLRGRLGIYDSDTDDSDQMTQSSSEDCDDDEQSINNSAMEVIISPQDEQMNETVDEEMDDVIDETVDEEMDVKTNVKMDENMDEKRKARMARKKMDEEDRKRRLRECYDQLNQVDGEVMKVREAQILGKKRFETDTKGIEPDGAILDSKLVEAGVDEAEALKQLTRLFLRTCSIVFPSGKLVLCSNYTT
ncbi:MAG: hypothetical protein Q9210_007015 [Variospora velana]